MENSPLDYRGAKKHAIKNGMKKPETMTKKEMQKQLDKGWEVVKSYIWESYGETYNRVKTKTNQVRIIKIDENYKPQPEDGKKKYWTPKKSRRNQPAIKPQSRNFIHYALVKEQIHEGGENE